MKPATKNVVFAGATAANTSPCARTAAVPVAAVGEQEPRSDHVARRRADLLGRGERPCKRLARLSIGIAGVEDDAVRERGGPADRDVRADPHRTRVPRQLLEAASVAHRSPRHARILAA